MTIVVYALLGGIIPSFLWLAFWLREDAVHPEPRFLILASYLGGALAVISALLAEKSILDVISNQTVRYTLWAAFEEIYKLVFVGAIALSTKHYDEPIDAMIYLITIAIGFSAVENMFFLLDPLSSGNISGGIAIQSMRFIGATLVHVVCSAIIGFAMGYVFYKGYISKVIAIFLGLAIAITLHTLFNLFIINASPSGTLKIFASIWLAVILLLLLFEEIKAVKPNSQISTNIIN